MSKLSLDATLIDRREVSNGIAPAEYRATPSKSKLIPRLPRQALKAPSGYMMPGRVMFVTGDPNGAWELPTDAMSPGGILLKTKNTFTEAVFYGIIVRCGVFTHSSHVHMHPAELEKINKSFPLKPGTLILHTNARPMSDAQERTLFVTCDHIQAFWTPDEVWPEQIQALRAEK